MEFTVKISVSFTSQQKHGGRHYCVEQTFSSKSSMGQELDEKRWVLKYTTPGFGCSLILMIGRKIVFNTETELKISVSQ